MPRRAVRLMTVVQEEIFAADDRHAGLSEDFGGEVFIGSERCSGRIVLRIPRAAAGAEMQRLTTRGDAEEQSRSAIEIAKFETEFSAGKRRIDRLVRIEVRLALSNLLQASHAISFDAVMQLFIARS